MIPWAPILGLLAGCISLAGGHLVLRLNRKAGLFQGLAGGMVLGAALFDLLPEAAHMQTRPLVPPFVITAMVMLACVVFGRLAGRVERLPGLRAGVIPAFLVFHSLIDGASIGLSFQVAQGTGWLVAAAILVHDLADGVNVASLAGTRRQAMLWLPVNAIAPFVGALLGSVVVISPGALAILLAALAGAFLYIGTFHLFPASYAKGPKWASFLLGGLGMLVMATLTQLAHGRL